MPCKRWPQEWDGQDRWYLEALGLALEKRESAYLSKLFDGSLYPDLELEQSGRERKVALPPYFPVDRNEAFILAGTQRPAGDGAEQVPGPGLAAAPPRVAAAAGARRSRTCRRPSSSRRATTSSRG